MAISWVAQTSTEYPPIGIGSIGLFNPLLMYDVSGSRRYYNIHYTQNVANDERLTFTSDTLSSQGTISAIPSTSPFRSKVLSTKLSDGRVFIGGGAPSGGGSATGTWLGTYTSATDTFSWVSSTSLPNPLSGEDFCHTLSDGRIFALNTSPGGYSYFGVVSGNSITWTQNTGWSTSGSSYYSSSTMLGDGRVLVVDGNGVYFLGTISSNAISWAQATLSGQTVDMREVRLKARSDGTVLVYSGTSASYTQMYVDNFQSVSISGNTLSFSILGSTPGGSFKTIYGAWELPSGKIGLVALGSANDAFFVGSTAVAAALEANLTSMCTLTSDLSVLIQLSASLASISTVIATLGDYIPIKPPRLLSSNLFCGADLTATLTIGRKLSADLNNSSELVAILSVGRALSADIQSSATLVASIDTAVMLVCDIVAEASITGALDTQVLFSSDLLCESSIESSLENHGAPVAPNVYVYIPDNTVRVQSV